MAGRLRGLMPKPWGPWTQCREAPNPPQSLHACARRRRVPDVLSKEAILGRLLPPLPRLARLAALAREDDNARRERFLGMITASQCRDPDRQQANLARDSERAWAG